MGRALRLLVADGWYHVTARGDERRAIFRGDVDCKQFPEPTPEEVARRLKALWDHRWISCPAYAGYARAPEWLSTDEILRRAPGQEEDPHGRYRWRRSAWRPAACDTGRLRPPSATWKPASPATAVSAPRGRRSWMPSIRESIDTTPNL